MIPTIANIRKAIYCLNKRIDLLEGGHYQDTMVQLSTKVKALESLVSDELNPTAAIDKFNEIISFLNLIENTGTLKDFLDSIHDDISTINLELSKINSELYELLEHEYVDLGLPSGTLWATMNVGANSITDYGNYYKYGLGASQYDNAQPDYSGTENPLAASADTVAQIWGGQWHMPTSTQYQELIDNTTREWTTIDGVNGSKFTAQNGNYVFLPAAGYWNNGSQGDVNNFGDYWSSSPNGSNSACYLRFDDSVEGVGSNNRERGYSIRPVLDSLPYNFVKRNEVGVTVASLDNNGKVPASLLPESNEFVAIYNETSFADVKTKFLEGKDIYVKYLDCKLGLTKVENIDTNSAAFRFSRSLGKSGAIIKLISTGWSVIGSDLTLVQADWNLVDDAQVDFIKNKPTIPNAQIQSDWNQTNTESKDYIKNKPEVYTKSLSDARYVINHDYVEIGGVKWATMNIGANSITDYGLYFAWGDTQGYTAEQVGSGAGQKYFGWADYKYGNGTNSPGETGMTKYNSTDGLTTLDASDDTAVANWGGQWRMPTTAEFQALRNAVNTAWTQVNNVYGILCTDKTDSSKTLFFPAAGVYYDGSVGRVGNGGFYWSSSLYPDDRQGAYYLYFDSNDAYWDDDDYRYCGCAIRCVLDETSTSSILSDWNLSDNTLLDYIKNKPTIPTKISDLLNDSSFLTLHLSLSDLINQNNKLDSDLVDDDNQTHKFVSELEKLTWNNKANIWRGTLAEYDLILNPSDNTIYIILSS